MLNCARNVPAVTQHYHYKPVCSTFVNHPNQESDLPLQIRRQNQPVSQHITMFKYCVTAFCAVNL